MLISIQGKNNFVSLGVFIVSLLSLTLFVLDVPVSARQAVRDIILADFEAKIPCSQCGDNLGYRTKDITHGSLLPDGANGTNNSAQFLFDSQSANIYFQGKVRRKYLATGTTEYLERGHNALSFWVKIPEDSPLLDNTRFNVWTYHWRPDDMTVGGKNNNSLGTDSNMHGYCNFHFRSNAARKWVNVTLSSISFGQARNYYHFYAGAANTEELDFFSSLRQLQIRLQDKELRPIPLQIDEVKLTRLTPTVQADKIFHRQEVSAKGGDVSIPVTLTNSTNKDRRYRVFISSHLGVDREKLNFFFSMTGDLSVMRKVQQRLGGDGGMGVVELIDSDGKLIVGPGREITIAAGKSWQGTLAHRIKTEMLGVRTGLKLRDKKFIAQRDTLTTSVIIWDPDDPGQGLAKYIVTRPSNTDDAKHKVPPGFPRQTKPAEGWRSEDIPLDQVGVNIVTVVKLK